MTVTAKQPLPLSHPPVMHPGSVLQNHGHHGPVIEALRPWDKMFWKPLHRNRMISHCWDSLLPWGPVTRKAYPLTLPLTDLQCREGLTPHQASPPPKGPGCHFLKETVSGPRRGWLPRSSHPSLF